MLEHLYPADSWRSIEFWTKLAAIVFGGFSAASGAISFLAAQNAKTLDAQPRVIDSAPASTETETTLRPISALIVAYGGEEAQSFAEQVASAMPPGSRISRIKSDQVIGLGPESLLYNANGNDPGALLVWLRSKGLHASETPTSAVPFSVLERYRDSVVLMIGPRKRTEP